MREYSGRAMHLEPSARVNSTTQRPREKLRRPDENTVLLDAVRDRLCETSFRQLYEYYSPRISSFLRQKGVDERISQELMQETMTRVWLKSNQFDARKANASTWIFTIARNLFIDRVRKGKRSEVDMNDPLLVVAQGPAPDARLDVDERYETLRLTINGLPEDQAEVLRLVYLHGLKQQAVAERLSIPLNTVKSRLRLALEKLRRLMEHA